MLKQRNGETFAMHLIPNMCDKMFILILFYYNGSYNWSKKV